jgi:hypothetical protein
MSYGIRRRIDLLNQWGWVFYRTSYTLQSDQQWPAVVSRINQLMTRSMLQRYTDMTRSQENHVFQLLNLTILEDKERFQNATFDDLRQHFLEWAPQQPKFQRSYNADPFWAVFLVIDEKAISSLLNSPDERDLSLTYKEFYLYVVQANFPNGPNWRSDVDAWYEEADALEAQSTDEEEDSPGSDEDAEDDEQGDTDGQSTDEEEDFATIYEMNHPSDANEAETPHWPGHFRLGIYFMFMLWKELLLTDLVKPET